MRYKKREGIMKRMKVKDKVVLCVLIPTLMAIILCWISSLVHFYRPVREEIADQDIVNMFALSMEDPSVEFDDDYFTVGNLAEYAIDDVSLAQIQLDAMTYVAQYFSGTKEDFGLDAIPVVINQRIYITKNESDNLVHGGAAYATNGEMIGIIIHVANIETHGVGQLHPKHAVFWVFVHEYVHCVRWQLGIHSSESSIEEGETTLTTALVLENVGIESDWYMRNLCTPDYRDWAIEAADNLGIEIPW